MTLDTFNNWLRQPDRPPLVMGVLNVTPDSFSDGNRYISTEAALDHACRMVGDGANILDLGAESTRPGSEPVSPSVQIDRLLPVLKAIEGRFDALISVDTTSAIVAEAALDAGADIINDISAGRADSDMLPLLAVRRTPVVLMHMQGTPATMQDSPVYTDVVREVSDFLRHRLMFATTLGIELDHVLLDPGIGFGKTVEHNLALLRGLNELASIGRPLVIGASRKGFIGKITDEPIPANRLFGTAATVAWCCTNGASIVRVHDVKAMSQVVRMIRAIAGTG